MVQPIIRNMMRQGRRCEAMNMKAAVTKLARKMVDDNGSLLKFVSGVMRLMILS